MFGKTERTVATGMSSEQPVTNITEAIKEASGAVKNNATLEVIDFKPVVESFDFAITSTADANGVNKTLHLFNNDFLQTNPTRNDADGTGGGTITITPGDGFQGKVYNKMLENSFGSRGIKIDEIILKANSISNTVGDEAYFSAVNMKLVGVDGEGNSVEKPIKWNLAASNQANKDGLYRMKVNFRLNYLSQLQLVITPDTRVNISLIPAAKQD